MEKILDGAWDLHFHTSPDVTPRKYSDLDLAREWLRSGMSGGVIKSHYADTTGRAALVRTLFPQLRVAGGLVLNRQAGGINPDAAERMAQAGGKFLWFPTLDSLSYWKRRNQGKEGADNASYLRVCDGAGKLLPAVYDILDIAVQYGLTVGTGHIGGQEGLPLVREAVRRGVEHMVLTHAENPSTLFPIEVQRECAKLGAMVEHSFFTVYHGRVSWEEMAAQIRAVDPEHCILVTDFGQPDSPGSAEGILKFAKGLLERGFTENEVSAMVKENPARLMGEI